MSRISIHGFLQVLIKSNCIYLSSFLLIIVFLLSIALTSEFEPFQIFRTFIKPHILSQTIKVPYCDYSNGNWIRDGTYKSQSYNESCPFLDPGFRCIWCGRKDDEYTNWRWQPKNCNLKRFNSSDILERSRNGRIVFAGDSIGRNQWESFLCMVSQGVKNKSTIYEVNGNPITKHKGFLSMHFEGYNLSVEYYRDPFLVYVGRPPKNSPEDVKMTIKLDEMHWHSKYWKEANVLVLNSGHWWNNDKTIKSGTFFEENGVLNKSMGVEEAFARSLHTIAAWMSNNVNLEKCHVFFRSYSPTHYRNGSWDDGGRCDLDVKPEMNNSRLEEEPEANRHIRSAVEEMVKLKVKAKYLDITKLSEMRFDGHPSVHREPGVPLPAPQDCSHWCLPGIPDTWNEIMYSFLLFMSSNTNLSMFN